MSIEKNTGLENPDAGGERAKILSTARLKVILSIFVVALLLALGGLAFLQVSRIFDQLTPAVAHDLAWKTERGVAELSYTTELGLALGESKAVKEAAATYLDDEDVQAFIALDADGKLVFSQPTDLGGRKTSLFQGEPGPAHELDGSYYAWLPVDIEGAEVGKLALQVSKKRLEAGDELRLNILKGMAGGSLVAFIVSLFFVSFYIGPLIRMTERAFTDLEERTREALESARLKSEFLANMSHEIRTPMNGVIGMAELLQKTDLSKKQRRYARTISTSASALLTIINDILDFSKIDAGKLSVRPVETDVKHLAEEVAQLLAPQAQSKGVEVMCSISPQVPREVMVDHDRLRQVLNNIMGNAVKFTNEGSVVLRVALGSHSRDDDTCVLQFSVTDTGIGIAPEDQKKVFEHFSQADGSLTRTAGGTGLGLSISLHLVALMGGSLELESELGKGSTFGFALSCPVVAGEGSRPSGKLPRTLIVDDNDTNRTVLEEIFEAWGVPNDSARSAAEALEMMSAAEARGEAFELALLDHVMDGMTGPELAAKIRERSGSKAPRLVLVTSLSESQGLDELFDDGLSKPVLQDDLRRVVQGPNARLRPEAEEDNQRLEFVGQPRILVAEDNPINREVMREILEELEVKVDLVENGALAIEALEKTNYPLILMDCQMPVMDGYEASRQIRRRKDEKANVPIIAVTAHAVQGEREKALAAGMTDYITKPVTIMRLVRMMAKYLETRAGVRSARPRDDEEEGVRSEAAVPHAAQAAERSAAASRRTVSTPAAEDAHESLAPESRRGDSLHSPSGAPTSRRIVLDPGVRRSKVVVGLFRKMVPDQIEGLREAVATGNSSEVKQVAHKLKGSCLALGAVSMAGVCAQLEPNPDDAHSLLGRLDQEHERVLGALDLEES